MKIFLSYAFTGEDLETVETRLVSVRDALVGLGHDVYCFHFDSARRDDMTEAECIARALERMNEYDAVLVLNTSERRSEGMLVEVGAALARSKKLIYAQHASSVGTSYAPSLADYTFIWHDEDELLTKTKEYFGLEQKHE